MLTKYIDPAYDLVNSFVLGDRLTDVELAKKPRAKAIFVNTTEGIASNENMLLKRKIDSVITLQSTDWKVIYEF
jgi:imidazoleglycerol-phosphate dehydratase/histidinol-phosphatase